MEKIDNIILGEKWSNYESDLRAETRAWVDAQLMVTGLRGKTTVDSPSVPVEDSSSSNPDLLGVEISTQHGDCSLIASIVNRKVGEELQSSSEDKVIRFLGVDYDIPVYCKYVPLSPFCTVTLPNGIVGKLAIIEQYNPAQNDSNKKKKSFSGKPQKIDYDKSDPKLVVELGGDLVLPIASFGIRDDNNGLCNYVQIGSEMRDKDSIFATSLDEKTSRYTIVEAIRSLLDDSVSFPGGITTKKSLNILSEEEFYNVNYFFDIAKEFGIIKKLFESEPFTREKYYFTDSDKESKIDIILKSKAFRLNNSINSHFVISKEKDERILYIVLRDRLAFPILRYYPNSSKYLYPDIDIPQEIIDNLLYLDQLEGKTIPSLSDDLINFAQENNILPDQVDVPTFSQEKLIERVCALAESGKTVSRILHNINSGKVKDVDVYLEADAIKDGFNYKLSIRGNAIDLSGKNTTPYITIEFNILKPNLFDHINSDDDRDKRAIEIARILDRITLSKWIQTPGEVTGNTNYEYFEPDENLDYKKEFSFYLTNSMILLSSLNTKHIGIITEKLKEIYGAKSVFFLKERVVRRSSSFYPDVILPVHVAGMQKGSFIIYT